MYSIQSSFFPICDKVEGDEHCLQLIEYINTDLHRLYFFIAAKNA